jgi:hypothetical protein
VNALALVLLLACPLVSAEGVCVIKNKSGQWSGSYEGDCTGSSAPIEFRDPNKYDISVNARAKEKRDRWAKIADLCRNESALIKEICAELLDAR